jgi:hypothetical protein
MLAPGDFIVERNRRMARTVEWLWDGIGDWRY